jgi:mono/diheme cytochrome c family protein
MTAHALALFFKNQAARRPRHRTGHQRLAEHSAAGQLAARPLGWAQTRRPSLVTLLPGPLWLAWPLDAEHGPVRLVANGAVAGATYLAASCQRCHSPAARTGGGARTGSVLPCTRGTHASQPGGRPATSPGAGMGSGFCATYFRPRGRFPRPASQIRQRIAQPGALTT